MGLKYKLWCVLFIGMLGNQVSGQAQYKAYLDFKLSNDILFFPNQNDRYFTNGFSINYSAPFISKSPFRFLLIGPGDHKPDVFGIKIHQNIYTPDVLTSDQIVHGDRPFAAYILFENYRGITNPEKHFGITTSLGMGVLGSYAYGGMMQNFIHALTSNSEKVLGWQNQMSNDILLSYRIKYEYGLINAQYLQININGETMLGTLKDYVKAGVYLQTGIFEPYFLNPLKLPTHTDFQSSLHMEISYTNMFYDATLQGGAIKNTSPYVLPFHELEKGRVSYKIGLKTIYKRWLIDMGLLKTGSEFKGAFPHSWGYLTLGIRM